MPLRSALRSCGTYGRLVPLVYCENFKYKLGVNKRCGIRGVKLRSIHDARERVIQKDVVCGLICNFTQS